MDIYINSEIYEYAAYHLWNDDQAFYPCIQYCASSTDLDTAGEEERTVIFQNDIVPFLETNSPVIAHLKRPYGVYGHYITLIGYNADTDEILYLDPYNADFDPRNSTFDPDTADWSQVIQSIPLETFITSAWYDNSENEYNAWWDGEWLGFTH